MLKATDKGKKSLLVFDTSSSESEDDSKQVKSKKKDALSRKGKENGKSDTKATTSEGLTINKGYADRYDNWRNLEEMQKLKNRLGVSDISELNEDDSSSESSSEEEDEWSTEKEKAFLKTLACLKTKDPKIYNNQFGFFPDSETTSSDALVIKSSKTKDQVKKPFTVRDHERTMILDKAGAISDDDSDDKSSRSNFKSYPEELASIKTAFSKALNEIDSSDDEEGGSDLLGSNLLKRRTTKSVEEKQKEDEDYKLWLKGELQKVEKGKLSKDEEKEFKSLREYWNDDKLDEGEKFLRDYILNKKYIDPLKGDKNYIPSYSEVIGEGDDLSDDEKFEAEREEFEHKYNFRFEEPDQDFIKRYPRTIQESLRREDTKRKEQRQKVKDRKEEVKARKKEEVQRLKALKRKEIMNKIQKLHEISGDPSLDLSEVDIDGDFDPKEYDRRMQQLFSDNYYQEEADEEKPVFEYDPEIDDDEDWEKWVPPGEDDDEDETIEVKQEDIEDIDDNEDDSDHKQEQADFIGRQQRKAAVQQEMIDASKSKRGRKKRSAFLDALEREKPKFDPKVHKSFEKYFEEYYKLDFEDIVGGDVKCRFKYHKTTANDFGLTTEEILKAEDKELNQWASLKKTFQYRADDEEEYEVKAYKRKAEREDLKKRVLLSVYQPTSDDKALQETDSDEEGQEKQKKKRKKKNKKKSNKSQENNSNRELSTETANALVEIVDSTKESYPTKKVKLNSSPEKRTATLVKKQESSVQSPTAPIPESVKLSKRQRKNKKRLNRSENSSDNLITTSSTDKNSTKKLAKQNETAIRSNKKRYFDKDSNNKRGMKRKAAGTNETNEVTKLDDDRLRSYGLNPKKFKKQIKYGNSATKK